jgi:hypothetical protein
MRQKKVYPCPICKNKRCVGSIYSFVANAVRRMYFCSNCLVEFNSNGTIYPPVQIEKDLPDGNLERSAI